VAVADGEVWRLVTCTLLHGGIAHLVFNAIWFLRFSTVIDNWLGPWFALALYAMVAASSSAAQLLVSPYVVLVGASGVVYGLFGFLWVMSRRRDDAAMAANRYTVETMLAWLVICEMINYWGGNIANAAHVWGLLLGWLLGQTFVARRRWRIPMAALTLVVWALPVVFTQRPVWDRTLAHVPPFNHWYPNRLFPGQQEFLEDPDHQPDVGIISSHR